jgi:drug/metabolite transporter (DMT)-like permease
MKNGSAILTQTFCGVASIVAFAVIAILFLNESLAPLKALGVILGIVSVFLITWQKK